MSRRAVETMDFPLEDAFEQEGEILLAIVIEPFEDIDY
jgi:hypothetical protein